MLTEALAKRGVEIERGWALTDLTQDDDAVTVSLRGEDGSIDTARCQWVIGCDSAHSAVRKAVGIPFAGSTYRNEFIMADAELDWALPHGELYGFPSPAGVFAAFSMPGKNRFRIFGAVPPRPDGPSAEYSEPTHEEFQALLDERLPFPATVVKEYWVTRYRVHSRSVPSLPRRASLPGRRRRTRAQPRRGPRHEHRHRRRLQPGVEACPGRTRHRRGVAAGQLPCGATPGGRPVAEDDRPIVLRHQRAATHCRGLPAAGWPRWSPREC